MLVFPDRTDAVGREARRCYWEGLAPVIEHGGVEILLLGFGRRDSAGRRPLRTRCEAAGIALEPMDTGAACRTYNVLAAEDRRVAAALMPPV